jgi:hypothetical protein
MSDTPRTDAYIEQFPDCRREPRLLDFCRRLAEARTEIDIVEHDANVLIADLKAEIERLKGGDLLAEEYANQLSMERKIFEKQIKLIKQMREALIAAKNDGKMQSAITYQLIIAALSAAERGEG